MVLYLCEDKKAVPAVHPCGKAAKALDDAGHSYEWKRVNGGTLKFWTWPNRARDRAEVEQLSGQRSVPILVLDDDDVVVGSAAIVSWAQSHPAGTSAS